MGAETLFRENIEGIVEAVARDFQPALQFSAVAIVHDAPSLPNDYT
jgi:hypothetical protein